MNDPLSLNLYSYCRNNPIKYWDPSGHKDVAVVASNKGVGNKVEEKEDEDGKKTIVITTKDGKNTTTLQEGKDFYIGDDGKAYYVNKEANAVRSTARGHSRDDIEYFSGDSPGHSYIMVGDVRIDEGVDYYKGNDGRAYYYNSVRTSWEVGKFDVDYDKDSGKIIITRDGWSGQHELEQGEDFYIGSDGRAHFYYSSAPPPPRKSSNSVGNNSQIGDYGEPNSAGFVLLPQKTTGNGYRTTGCNNNPTADHQWGTPQTIANIIALGELWAETHEDGYIGIVDINAPGHSSHKLGVDVDIQLMRKDGTAGANYKDDNYSQDLTRELIQAILATGDVELIFFNDPVLIEEFGGIVRKTSENDTVHDHHLHVRYRQ
jgi:hypothetical protein